MIGEATIEGRSKKYWVEAKEEAQGHLAKVKKDKDAKEYWRARIKFCEKQIKGSLTK